MIETKHLEEFINALVVHGTEHYSPPIDEYREEIITRLRERDRLIATMSSEGDKEE